MKNKLYLGFVMLVLNLSGCDKKEDLAAESPFMPFDGVEDLPANCNVEVVKVKRITNDDEVSDDAQLTDYFFTLKSIKTEKEKISVEGRYVQGGEVIIVTADWKGTVGIDETVEIKISSNDINPDEGYCIEYVVKVEVDGSSDCEFVATDC